KNHEIDFLAEDIFGLFHVVGEPIHRSNIVCNADPEPVQIFYPDVRQACQIEVEVVAAHCENLTVTLAEIFKHVLTFQIARVDDNIASVEQLEHALGNGLASLPVRIGKDCNSHSRLPP